MITFPVRAAGDGTERILDGNDEVLGTLQVVESLNTLHNVLGPVRAQIPNVTFNNDGWDIVVALTPAEADAIRRA